VQQVLLVLQVLLAQLDRQVQLALLVQEFKFLVLMQLLQRYKQHIQLAIKAMLILSALVTFMCGTLLTVNGKM